MLNELQNISQPQKILNAAFKCVSSKGYANVSLRDIADEAGVVLSQLNYYYKNKEGLFTEVIKSLTEKYLTEIEQELKKGNLAKEKLSNVISYFKKVLTEKPELFKLLYDVTGMGLWSSVFRKLLQSMYKSLSDLIEKYIFKDHSVKSNKKNYSPKVLSRMILGTLVGTAIQVILNPEEDVMKSLDAVNTILD